MKKLKWWQAVLIILAAVLLIVVGRYVYVMFIDPLSAFEPPAQTESPTASPPLPGEPTPLPTPTLSPEEALLSAADLEFMKNKVNILMLGWDESPERTEDEDSELYRDENNNFRSDVLMLLTIDFEQHTAKLISIPRDTLAPIYNTKGHWKINAAFALGGSAKGNGFEYAINTVSSLLGGIPINYYAGVNMTGIKAVVDAMGGVDYDVDQRIVLNGRVLETGYQHLNGQQVLDYCRARKGISTDVGRTDRQQRILFAIFEQLKSKNQLVNLPKIFTSVQGYINTNLNLEQIAALSVFALDLKSENLTRATLDGEYITKTAYSNGSFYVLHNDELVELVKDTFGITIKPDIRYDAAYVKAQKAAKEAGAYTDAADYVASLASPLLQTIPGLSESYHSLVGARDKCLSLIDLDDADSPKQLSVKKIEAAQEKLRLALVDTLTLLGKTKADFSTSSTRKLLPADVISDLPAASPIATPVPTGGGLEPIIPTPSPEAGGTVDPEAIG
ncbi:MAG: LCP family protein [Bacillota bacterium]